MSGQTNRGRELAEALGREAWHVVGPPWGNGDFVISGHPDPHLGKFVACTEDDDYLDEWDDRRDGQVLERAEFIAYHNPLTVARIHEEVERLRGEAGRLRGVLATGEVLAASWEEADGPNFRTEQLRGLLAGALPNDEERGGH